MTTCNPTKIRDLIATHLGKEKLTEYDYAMDQCKLGQALKDDRVWAPLCPAYPNLKGITCEEIDEFLEGRRSGFLGTEKFRNYINDIFYIDASTKDILKFIEQNTDEEEFYKIVDDTDGMDRDAMFAHFIPRDKGGTEIKRESTEFTKDYLHHVKVYDHDEEYEAFKNIGDQIETDMPRVLHDPSTIFVTTPRGGHEMLSIFTYANEIDKAQIPSDIRFQHMTCGAPVSDEKYRDDPIRATKYLERIGYDEGEEIPTDVYGKTWLDNMSHHIKTIFIVDDIIASGHQIYETAESLGKMFPDAEINSVTMCKRNNIHPALPSEINNYYTDTKTTGIDKFKSIKGKRDLFYKEYITCLFPHACPDGESDKPMIELMGERCSPEKRISRRDL